jgi:hypothetical protein
MLRPAGLALFFFVTAALQFYAFTGEAANLGRLLGLAVPAAAAVIVLVLRRPVYGLDRDEIWATLAFLGAVLVVSLVVNTYPSALMTTPEILSPTELWTDPGFLALLVFIQGLTLHLFARNRPPRTS